MPLKKITTADFNTAIKKLTTSDASVWWKVLATTDEGTDLCFVVGWEYYDDKDDRFYQDKGYTICAKIGYKPHNLMVMDYDDIYMPFDKRTGDVWDTDSAVDKDNSRWDMLARSYNSSASAIWRKYGKLNKDGITALDLMESKNKEAKKHTCSMQKKKESLTKKNEGDYGAMTWTVTVEFDDNGKSVRKDYVVKAHNRDSAIDQAKLKPRHTNPDAKNIKVAYCKLGESLVKKYTCSMQKKKESLAKKCEEYIPNVRERLWSFIDAGFITTEEIGDYLLRALSVDTLENVYEWLVQDEMIPSEETLADEHQLKFNNEGEFVSIETDDTKEG